MYTVQRVSLSPPPFPAPAIWTTDMQGVTISTASSMDMQGVTIATASSMYSTCRVYHFDRQQYGHAWCTHFLRQQYARTCRLQGVPTTHFDRQQCGQLDMHGVPISTASSMDMQGVSISTASSQQCGHAECTQEVGKMTTFDP